MSENNAAGQPQNPDPAAAAPKPGEQSAPPNSQDPAQDELERWKADARKWEDRAKANKDAADRLAELENANKTEAQKLQEQFDAVKAERDTFQGELNSYQQREQVQQWAKELTKESHISADLLRGSTREELEEHHAQLQAQFPLNTASPRHVLGREGETTPLSLNGDGIENALKGALGIR